MDNKKTYWYEILKHYQSKGYFKHGLTIPFLIGARIIVEPNVGLLSIKDFIEDVYSFSGYRTILKCSDIGEYVIGLLDNDTNEIRKKYNSLYKEFGNLICIDQSFDNMSNSDEVITNFINIYQPRIDNEEYSKNCNKNTYKWEWTAFTPKDKERLTEVYLLMS